VVAIAYNHFKKGTTQKSKAAKGVSALPGCVLRLPFGFSILSEEAAMKPYALALAIFFVVASPSLAQRSKLVVNAETPEGKMLQQIGEESDEAKKLTMLEQFISQNPKHEAAGWVYGQMQELYLKQGQSDKALDAGERLLAIHPDDIEAVFLNLKAAEAKKDPDLVKKWSGLTSQAASKIAATPQPGNEDEVAAWKKQAEYAKQLNSYSEDALYRTGLQTTDPRKKVELSQALAQQNPQSEFMSKMAVVEFDGYRKLGDGDKAAAAAERALASDKDNEELLLFVADNYLQKKREPEKVLAYSARIVDLMKSKPKPDTVDDASWEKRKAVMTGLANWIAGSVYVNQNKFAQADKSLRAALPLVGDNDQLKAGVLFYLGLSNYKLNRVQDAVTFNKQCAAIKSPFQAQAQKNLAVMQSQKK
jgi:tetratricopeptide (TPR) repeat protein